MRKIWIGLLLAVFCLAAAGSALADGVLYHTGSANEWEYKIIDGTGSAMITRFDPSGLPAAQRVNITVPSTVDGIPVFALDENAFYGNTTMQHLTLPDSLTLIGVSVFRNCTALTEVTIPGSVLSVGEGAFFGCTALQSATLSEGVQSLGKDAFRNCSALTQVSLPDSLSSINGLAFAGCTSLEEIVIPEGISELKLGVFQGCTALTDVTLPAALTTVGMNAFSGCTALETLALGDDVTLASRAVPDTCLIVCRADSLTAGRLERFADPAEPEWVLGWLTAGDELCVEGYLGSSSHPVVPRFFSDVPAVGMAPEAMAGRTLDTLSLPAGTQSVAAEAFAGVNTCAVSIPDSVETIGAGAFSGNRTLYRVEIQSTTVDIDDSAFDGCPYVTLVTQSGNDAVIDYAVNNGLNWLEQ